MDAKSVIVKILKWMGIAVGTILLLLMLYAAFLTSLSILLVILGIIAFVVVFLKCNPKQKVILLIVVGSAICIISVIMMILEAMS